MTNINTIESFAQVAAPAGLAIGAFLYFARDLIAKNIFPKLSPKHAYHIILALSFMAWTIALSGIGAWAYVQVVPRTPLSSKQDEKLISEEVINSLSARDFDSVYSRLSDGTKDSLPPHIIAANWEAITNKLGAVKSISKPTLSTYRGRPAYVATYQGENEMASIFIGFDTHSEINLLWFDWSR